VFDHVTIRCSDRPASERFYRAVLATLGLDARDLDAEFVEWREFSLAQARDDRPVTRRLHIGFVALSREHVDAFWRAGLDAGYRDDGEPGPRPQYGPTYYGGFLLDPDGNSTEAVHHDETANRGGAIDHLWIRVAELAPARRFYEQVGGLAGFALRRERTDRVQFAGPGGSFSVVADAAPTEHVHLAFRANAADVDAFHRALTDAGHRDNGAPGERPEYHPGYYGAFVLDPDGNNVELVDHHRT
jgi:catechol 2,3-dioxygenase-like lactoylglutathione lyase family enzyme